MVAENSGLGKHLCDTKDAPLDSFDIIEFDGQHWHHGFAI